MTQSLHFASAVEGIQKLLGEVVAYRPGFF